MDDQAIGLTALAVLRTARSKLAQGFLQGRLAADADGNTVDPEDPRATCFCLVGALRASRPGMLPSASASASDAKVWRCIREELFAQYREKLMYQLGLFNSLQGFNDTTCKEDVLGLVDAAIGLLEVRYAGKTNDCI